MSGIYKAYAGITNPDTPPDIVQQIAKLASRLSESGYTCRTSGGSEGDDAFENNSTLSEVHIPWKKFNNKETKFNKNLPEAADLVKPFHPTFDAMKPAVQAIIARGAHVILGQNLQSPVQFVLCWSADGLENAKDRGIKSGFIGIPIALAATNRIPVFNLKNPDALQRLKNWLEM
jgi:hypothetical protein